MPGNAVGNGDVAIAGYPDDVGSNIRLIPVYEVEWIETDDNFVMQRYETIRIGDEIYILRGKNDDVIRSKSDPKKCTLSINGVYFMNRSSEPYSLVLACAALQDKYNLLHFYRDQLIASSGTIGDIIDVSLLPKFLGAEPLERLQKAISYKKNGTLPIDSSQESRLNTGQAAMNTIFNGYDDTIKAPTIQAIQMAIDSIEQECSSITGVFRERLNGIQQRDAVTNVQTSVNNSFTITKPYLQQMDLIINEMLLDSLNTAKVVYKNGLEGTLILGDKLQKVFTALPEHFTLTDFDIHIISSSDVIRDIETIKAMIPEFIKAGTLDPDVIFDVLTCKSLTDVKYRVHKALKKKAEENDQLQQLAQQNQQLQQQLQQTGQDNQKLQQKVEQLNESKLQLEQTKINNENQIAWFKARIDKTFKEGQIENDSKRVEIELQQLYDGNPYNDKVRNG